MYVSDFHFTGFISTTHKADYTKTLPISDPIRITWHKDPTLTLATFSIHEIHLDVTLSCIKLEANNVMWQTWLIHLNAPYFKNKTDQV